MLSSDTGVEPQAPPVLTGAGAQAQARDWAATPLGRREGWAPPLGTAVAMVLAAPSPMAVIWGPDHILVGNDAWRAWSGDPGAVPAVAPAGALFPDGWDEIGPVLGDILAGDGAAADVALPRAGHGAPLSAAFSPIVLEDGSVGGVLAVGRPAPSALASAEPNRGVAFIDNEDRQAFLLDLSDDLRILNDPAEIAGLAANRLGERLGASRVFYAEIDNARMRVERDYARGVPSLVGLHSLEAFGPDLLGAYRAGAVITMADVAADQRLTAAARAGLQSRSVGAFVDVVLFGEEDWVGLLAVQDARPRFWTAAEENLIREVAERVKTAVERSRAEVHLRDSEARYRTLFAAMDEGFCLVEFIDGPHGPLSDYVHLDVNPAYVRHAGILDIVGRTGRDALTPHEAEGWVEIFRRVLESGQPVRFERELEATGRCLEVACFPVEPKGGRQLAILFKDITARRRAEDGLRHLNETLEQQVAARTAERDRMWRTSPDLMLVIDFDGVIRRVNPAWTTLLGYTPDELIGRHVNDFVLAEDHADTIDAYRLGATGEAAALVNRYRHKDGSVRWIAWTGAPAGDMTYATGRDVTDARARNAELRRYRDIVESTAAPICAFDTDFRLIAFNRAHNEEFRRVNGFDTKVGDVFPDLFVPEQRPLMRELMARALAGESFIMCEAFGRPELGAPCWEISYTPLHDEGGQIIGAFHLAKDISARLAAEAELEAAQEALRQSQKMEAMGSLTGGVAHDFNNLLTPIIGSLDMLVRKEVGTERERRLISGALQSAERAKTLVQRLLAFARRQPLQPVPVDVAGLVNGMAGLIGSTLGPTIEVRLDLAPDLPAAMADPNQLEMALLNLAVNARDAMAGGGELTIAASRQLAAEKDPSGLAPGAYVRLGVSDTGEGMDEETRKRAVEPFYSTKGIGKGTGLGLSMVHGLAAQLGGGLRIHSAPGQGATVELWLPVCGGAADDAAPAAEQAPGAVKALGAALLVDDEDLVRMSTAAMLADLGYAVVEASSADEALRLLDGGLKPDLLLTDHIMPGMSGADLARRLKAAHPDLPVLVVSGYAEAAGIDPDLPRLSKPFRSAELAESLAALCPAAAA